MLNILFHFPLQCGLTTLLGFLFYRNYSSIKKVALRVLLSIEKWAEDEPEELSREIKIKK